MRRCKGSGDHAAGLTAPFLMGSTLVKWNDFIAPQQFKARLNLHCHPVTDILLLFEITGRFVWTVSSLPRAHTLVELSAILSVQFVACLPFSWSGKICKPGIPRKMSSDSDRKQVKISNHWMS
jgi:hypothetical protein